MFAYLECVVTGRYLLGPYWTDPDNGAKDAGIGPRQDPVLNRDPLKQLVFVKHLLRHQVLIATTRDDGWPYVHE